MTCKAKAEAGRAEPCQSAIAGIGKAFQEDTMGMAIPVQAGSTGQKQSSLCQHRGKHFLISEREAPSASAATATILGGRLCAKSITQLLPTLRLLALPELAIGSSSVLDASPVHSRHLGFS